MAAINEEILVKFMVLAALQTENGSAKCFIYNAPSENVGTDLFGVVVPIGGSFDSIKRTKKIPYTIYVISNNIEVSLAAVNVVFDAVKDYEAPSSATESGRKVLMYATTLPVYDGVDAQNQEVCSFTLELTSTH